MGSGRIAGIALAAWVAWSQPAPNTIQRLSVQAFLRADPPGWEVVRRFYPSARSREMPFGRTFYTRVVAEGTNHLYFGYELLVEQQQAGVYLATFGKLGVTPLDLATSNAVPMLPSGPVGSEEPWSMRPLPAIPAPQTIRDGETIRIDLFVDAVTREKLVDEIHVAPYRPLTRAAPEPPTVSGAARDFAAGDADLEIVQPRVRLNGRAQATGGPASVRNAHGPLVWLYFPNRGRYILSLVPRAGLGFQKAGEVRGGGLTFALDGDSVELQCMTAIAPGYAAYHLYVLHDPNWEPVAERQKDWPASGSIGVDELTALRQR